MIFIFTVFGPPVPIAEQDSVKYKSDKQLSMSFKNNGKELILLMFVFSTGVLRIFLINNFDIE